MTRKKMFSTVWTKYRRVYGITNDFRYAYNASSPTRIARYTKITERKCDT